MMTAFSRWFIVSVSITVVIGLAVITGWLVGSDMLLTLFPGQVRMKFNAAVLLELYCISLLTVRSARKGLRVLARMLAVVVIVVAALTLLEYLAGADLHIDQLLVKDPMPPGPNYIPGRMSAVAAGMFVLLGTCILCAGKPRTVAYQFTVLTMITFLAAIMMVGINFIADAPASIRMAVHLALAMILLSMATWYAQPELHSRVVFERKLYTGFFSILLMVAAIALYSYYNNIHRIRNSFWIRHTSQVIRESGTLLNTINNIQVAVLVNGVARQPALTEEVPSLVYTAKNTLVTIKSLTADNMLQQQRTDTMLHMLSQPLQAVMQPSSVTRLWKLAEKLGEEENRLLVARQAAHESSIRSSNTIFFVFIGLVSLLITGLFVSFRYNYFVRRKSEQKFKALLESSPDAKVIVNDQGIIQLINLQTELMFGYQRNELIGQPVEIMMPEGLRSQHVEHRKQFVKNSRVREMGIGLEINAQRKNGAVFPVEISLAPIKTEEGHWISASIRDIEERKKAQENIRYLATLIENTTEAVFSCDKHFMLKSWNKAAEQLFGYTEQEVIGKPLTDVIRPQIPEEQRELIRAELHMVGFWKGELGYLRKDGIPLYLLMSNTVTRDAKGETEGYVSVCRDFSERRKLETQLRSANAELEAFTYSVSHDLRAPIRAITGFTNILDAEYTRNLDEEARRLMNIIKTNAHQMGNLIDDLLNFARTSRQDIVRHPFSMDKLVAEVVAPFKQDNPKIEWTISSLPDSKADMNMIRQVWVNLVSNAVKYSSGRETPQITIGHGNGDRQQIYFIRDNGVGFDEAYKSKLFQVFQRLHTSEHFEGTGVGLAIVEKVITKHGGRIWAESDGKSGATFYFSLPNIH